MSPNVGSPAEEFRGKFPCPMSVYADASAQTELLLSYADTFCYDH